jgi:hypothetical protein
VFFKKGERFRVRLRTLSSFADNQVDFNLDNGTITAGSVGTITNNIAPVSVNNIISGNFINERG